MNHSISSTETLKNLLGEIVSSPVLHVKWVNTLSFLENCGARKIAACQHPTQVKEEMLKHAAEEFRHAYYLKHQMGKISSGLIGDYPFPYLLGGVATQHYLPALDVQTSRYLSKTIGLPRNSVKEVAYLLVTYAIELRAGELYPLYDEVLRKSSSKVVVKSILLEEKEHLNEMCHALSQIPSGLDYAKHVCAFEEALYRKWISAMAKEVLG